MLPYCTRCRLLLGLLDGGVGSEGRLREAHRIYARLGRSLQSSIRGTSRLIAVLVVRTPTCFLSYFFAIRPPAALASTLKK